MYKSKWFRQGVPLDEEGGQDKARGKRSTQLFDKAAVWIPSAVTNTSPKDPVRLDLESDPSSLDSLLRLGAILGEQGRLAESLDCFESAIKLEPFSADAFNNAGVALQRLGRLSEATERYRQAITIAPNFLEAQVNFAALCGLRGFHDLGLNIIGEVMARNPHLLCALTVAATLESAAGRPEAALAWVNKALDVQPSHDSTLSLRAEILCQLLKWGPALLDCIAILSSSPDDRRANHLKGLALAGLNRPTEALKAFERAEQGDGTERAAVISDHGWLLAEMGKTEEATAAFNLAIEIQPNLVSAWCQRTYLVRTVDPEELIEMEALAENRDLSFGDRVNLSFALGQSFLRLNDGERAFHWLHLANQLKRRTVSYDAVAEEQRAVKVANAFSQKFLDRMSGFGDPSDRPIFVFGMPRSGTTLLEQILGSHPLVYAGGELTFLSDLIHEAGRGEINTDDPSCLAEIGWRYLELTSVQEPNAIRFVDKMPWNFNYAGLISAILPNARMIHCRRDALDTCLSCYSTNFTCGQNYSYNLTELGRYYRLYESLMGHWREIVPSNRLLEVDYESVVLDAEKAVGQILDFCNLPWDDRCLRFYESDRRVTSASLAQVRTPLYNTSLGRARRFLPWIGELDAALQHNLPKFDSTGSTPG